MATNIDKYVEPSEIPASTAVPVGGVIMWMNPSAASINPTPPPGFEFCDGTAVTTIGSPLIGQIKPNLMITSAGGAKGVARGANVTAAPYGVGTPLVTGGSDTHNHTTNSAGSHNHDMQNHSHNLNGHVHAVSVSGSHTHNGFTDTANQTGVPATGATYAGGLFYHNHAIPSSGSTHDHGNTAGNSDQSAGPSTNSTGSGGAHTHPINNNSVFPAFHTELAFVVRVL